MVSILTMLNKENDKLEASEYFNHFDEEILIEMACNHPKALQKMCSLISLDAQLDKESYDKNISDRREVC